MILAIVGSRSFNDYDKMCALLTDYAEDEQITTILTGGAKGADTLAERWAIEHKKRLCVIRPDYSKYEGKLKRIAPLERNTRIAGLADIVIAFYGSSTRSNGTDDTCRKAEKLGKVVIRHYQQGTQKTLFD